MATKFISGIADRFDEIVRFPLSGAPRPQLAPELSVIFNGNYAIYYLPLTSEIVIIRVLHGSRDLNALVEQGGFVL